MTFMLTCDCPDPTSTCSLEQAIANVLSEDAAFAGVQIYTGDLASMSDTANAGPTIPFLVLSDLGPNNSRRVGENLVQHEVTVRLRFYVTTDVQGLSLARTAFFLLQAAGQLETADGYACMSQVMARSRPLKLTEGRWMIQVNQTFFVHASTWPPVVVP